MSKHKTDLLIIGAGPFGLAVAAQASHLGIEHLVTGKPMEFWKQNMPAGMYLRSACDWHLDPTNIHTIDNFLAERGQTAKDVEPLSLEFYLSYAEWFQKQKQITVMPWHTDRRAARDAPKRGPPGARRGDEGESSGAWRGGSAGCSPPGPPRPSGSSGVGRMPPWRVGHSSGGASEG